jgi:hypothetical protein
VLLVVFPMRSECREPHHSRRTAIISTFVKTIALTTGESTRMGNPGATVYAVITGAGQCGHGAAITESARWSRLGGPVEVLTRCADAFPHPTGEGLR